MKRGELEEYIGYIFDEKRKYLETVKQLGEYGETKYEILRKMYEAAEKGQGSITIYRTSQEETDEIYRTFNKDFLVWASDWMQDGWPEGYKITIEFRDE